MFVTKHYTQPSKRTDSWAQPKNRKWTRDLVHGMLGASTSQGSWEECLGVWTGFDWLRIESGGGLLWVRWWTFRFFPMELVSQLCMDVFCIRWVSHIVVLALLSLSKPPADRRGPPVVSRLYLEKHWSNVSDSSLVPIFQKKIKPECFVFCAILFAKWSFVIWI
jgi:hypothetical protein